jgi:hypothetical protein
MGENVLDQRLNIPHGQAVRGQPVPVLELDILPCLN